MLTASAFTALVYLTSWSSAHFIVNVPPAIGGGKDVGAEDQSPCGGFSPSSADKPSEFHVGGDAISLTTLHPQSHLLYRGMKGTSLKDATWTSLWPVIEEFGLNNFCLPKVQVPSSWAGSEGLLQVVQNSEDGTHYQVLSPTASFDLSLSLTCLVM